MKKEETPIWFKVLEHFDQKRYIRNGSTIPFLIGSEQIINPDKIQLSVTDFLNQGKQKLPSHINLMKCPDLGEFVIGLIDNQTLNFLKGNPKNIYKKFGGLMITDNSFEKETWNKIVNDLHNLYQPIINEGKFTFQNGEWTYFTQKELDRIIELNH